jgi:predicted glutamine amidotransferase
MCRFVAYAGAPLLLADLLYRPADSLIMQSHHARERPEPLNGDGVGVGWYAPEVDPTPCVLRSVTPAWSNRNLQSLSFKIRASLLFAHVRAASPGMFVTETNTHPFAYDRLMWMHNGSVAEFGKIKRRLRDGLRDEFYDMISGTTDSEHAFALFLNSLRVPLDRVRAADLRAALVETIARLNELTCEAGITAPSYYNFAVTDGSTMVISRYCSAEGVPGASLHYSRGSLFECRPDGLCDMQSVGGDERAQAVIVSSERLTEDLDDWHAIPDNHTVTVLPDRSLKVEKIKLSALVTAPG